MKVVRIKFIHSIHHGGSGERVGVWLNPNYVPPIGTRLMLGGKDESFWAVRDQLTYDIDGRINITLFVEVVPPMIDVLTDAVERAEIRHDTRLPDGKTAEREVQILGRQWLDGQISFKDLVEAVRRIQEGEPPYGDNPVVRQRTGTPEDMGTPHPHRAWVKLDTVNGRVWRTWCCEHHLEENPPDATMEADVGVYNNDVHLNSGLDLYSRRED